MLFYAESTLTVITFGVRADHSTSRQHGWVFSVCVFLIHISGTDVGLHHDPLTVVCLAMKNYRRCFDVKQRCLLLGKW